MKKLLFTIVALLAVSAVSAQSPRTIAEAQALYDNTVIGQRRAVEEAKSEERLTVDAAERRLNLVKSDLQEVKENYRRVVEEHKASVAKAKAELGWEAKYGIEEMVRDSWNWQRENPEGYR